MINKIKGNDNFIKYCSDNGIDYDKIMRLPRCYGKDIIRFQIVNKEKGRTGLMDDTPAKVLLTVEYSNGEFIYQKSDDILDFVGTGR